MSEEILNLFKIYHNYIDNIMNLFGIMEVYPTGLNLHTIDTSISTLKKIEKIEQLEEKIFLLLNKNKVLFILYKYYSEKIINEEYEIASKLNNFINEYLNSNNINLSLDAGILTEINYNI